MSKINWTKEQLDAIEARGAKVLVNAAAGSGKTAVLTTRIINRLVPVGTEEPVRADRLLVVTFTRAAANEMRERIERGLKEELHNACLEEDNKKKRFVSKQIKQLQAAKICTIDSFCQLLVKEYFHVLNIDPGFRIAQKSEERQMRDDVFEKLSEQLYAEKDKAFMLLVTKCTKSGKEDMVKDWVENICNFTSNMPYPIEFIEQAAEEYLVKNGLYNTMWCQKTDAEQRERLNLYAASVLEISEECSNISNSIRELTEMSFEDRMYALQSFSVEIPAELDDASKETIFELVKEIHDFKDIFSGDIGEVEEFLKEVFYPETKALCEVCIKFLHKLDELKRSKSLFSFSDIERMAYCLLAENETVKEEQKARFDEILIDEYQDTNELQDGIFEMLTNGNNLFMVGDMKQSIYRFRGSEPLVFRSKADVYSPEADSLMRKITLTKNYRSRNEVLLSVNDLFKCCMSRVVGELTYDESEQLNLGNEGFDDTEYSYKSEFALLEIDGADDDAPSRGESEAEYIASRIYEMKKNGFLVSDKGGLRPVKNSDIVILMSSHKTDGEIYIETLAKYGIDCTCVREGYFEKNEIKLLISLLSAVDNAERDVQMASVMRSFIGGFSDDEIARIRINARDVSLYASLCDIYAKYIRLKENGKISSAGDIFGKKVGVFLSKLTSWRDKARYMSAEQLVNMLLEDAGFYAFFAEEEQTRNLQLFFDRARQFEKSGYRGLFTFLRHMQRLADSGEDLEDRVADSDSNSVRIMTIHKSKGLEFPVVFLAGAGKRFNRSDSQGKLLMHTHLGISLDYMDYNSAVLIVSPVREIFEKTTKSELLSEEMRKLYVALTRAKEKIIVTAGIKKTSKTQEKLDKWAELGSIGMKNEAKKANCFADWIAPVSMNSENWEFSYIQGIEPKDVVLTEKKITEKQLHDLEKVKQILEYSYPFEAKSLKSKAAVSDFKAFSHIPMSDKPKFLSGNKISGADFGTAVHKIMETLPRNMGRDTEYVRGHIKKLAEDGDISVAVAETIAPEKITGFFVSDIGKRFTAAKKIYSESEFEISCDAEELYGDASLSGEKILLQGIIDCWFEEEDGIVLVDYKTDKINNLDEIHQKYDVQLSLYAQALEKIAKKRVKEKFIYLFSEDCVIQC